MDKHPRRTLFVNIFGALGYMCCLILWGWSGMLYAPMLLENENVEQLFLPTPSEPGPTLPAPALPSPIGSMLAVVITAIVLIATVVAIIKTPKTIARSGQTITIKAATSALPLIAKGQQLTPAKKQRLTARLIKLTKLLLATLPVVITGAGAYVELPLPLEVALLVSSFLAICALLLFSAQYAIARILGVNLKLLI